MRKWAWATAAACAMKMPLLSLLLPTRQVLHKAIAPPTVAAARAAAAARHPNSGCCCCELLSCRPPRLARRGQRKRPQPAATFPATDLCERCAPKVQFRPQNRCRPRTASRGTPDAREARVALALERLWSVEDDGLAHFALLFEVALLHRARGGARLALLALVLGCTRAPGSEMWRSAQGCATCQMSGTIGLR